MKLTQELWFFAKRIDKGILSTPFKIWDTNYVRSNGTIYSDLIFTNHLTWKLLEESYSVAKWEDDLSKLQSLVNEVISWREIDLEDINTYDALWNVAGIDWTDHWIDIWTLANYRKMCSANNILDFRLRINNNWLIAFTTKNKVNDEWYEKVLIIAWLLVIQRSLLD